MRGEGLEKVFGRMVLGKVWGGALEVKEGEMDVVSEMDVGMTSATVLGMVWGKE